MGSLGWRDCTGTESEQEIQRMTLLRHWPEGCGDCSESRTNLLQVECVEGWEHTRPGMSRVLGAQLQVPEGIVSPLVPSGKVLGLCGKKETRQKCSGS